MAGAMGAGQSQLAAPKKPQKVHSLKHLAKDIVSRVYSKAALNVIIATNTFPKSIQVWKEDFKHKDGTLVGNTGQALVWYSKPEYIPCVGYDLYSALDCHHLYVNARSIVCSKGIPRMHINKEAWHAVAKNNRVNKTGLSEAMVMNLIDRQSNAFAQTTFSLKVETEMRNSGWSNEANFCQLLREWYEAEDEVGLSSEERCIRRLRFRDFLLQDNPFGTFPPPGNYVKDMPIVMFEGIVTNIERRIQLYSVVRGGSYNVRSVGSLDSETYFSSFQDLDPKGSGVLLPDDIPKVMETATFLAQSHHDPERYK